MSNPFHRGERCRVKPDADWIYSQSGRRPQGEMLPREGVTYLVGMAGYVEGQPVVFIRDFNNWFDAEAFDRIIPACDAHRAK